MIIFDAILLFILAGFIFYGLFFGLIRTLGSLVGVVVGAWIAGHFYLTFFNLINELFFGLDNLGKVICFIFLFLIVNRLVSFGFSILEKTFNLLSILPFLKTINRLGGALLGFVEGGLVLGLIIYVVARYAGESFIATWLAGSEIAPFLLNFAKVLLPLLPELLKTLKSVI